MYPKSLEDPAWRRALEKAQAGGGADLARPSGPARWVVGGAGGTYVVNWVGARPICTCTAGAHERPCYHAAAVMLALPPVWCPSCGSVRVLSAGAYCAACAAREAAREAEAAAAIAALLRAMAPSPEATERILRAALAAPVAPPVSRPKGHAVARSA